MTLDVNGEPREVADGATLAGLVGEIVPSGRGVAVAIDGDIVPRSQWPDTTLAEGQRVEVLSAAQGG